MNEVPPGSPSPITFIARHQGGGLPVALACEAVALGHQPLRRKARELQKSVQIFERGRKGLEAAGFEEVRACPIRSRAIEQRFVPERRRAQCGRDCVKLLVLGHQRFDLGVGDLGISPRPPDRPRRSR